MAPQAARARVGRAQCRPLLAPSLANGMRALQKHRHASMWCLPARCPGTARENASEMIAQRAPEGLSAPNLRGASGGRGTASGRGAQGCRKRFARLSDQQLGGVRAGTHGTRAHGTNRCPSAKSQTLFFGGEGSSPSRHQRRSRRIESIYPDLESTTSSGAAAAPSSPGELLSLSDPHVKVERASGVFGCSSSRRCCCCPCCWWQQEQPQRSAGEQARSA